MRGITSYKIFGLLLASLLVLSACKKDSNSPATNNSSGSTIITTSQPSSASSFYGILDYEQQINFTKAPYSLTTLNSFDAYFSYSPASYQNSATYLKVDSVRANSSQLTFNTDWYSLLTNQNFNLPISWSVMGKGPIPSFVYTNSDSLPRYYGYSLLPDTIYRSDSLVLNFTNLYNVDALNLQVQIGANGAFAPLSTSIPNNAHSATIVFPQSMVSWLSPSQNGYISVKLQRINKRKISNKDFQFTTSLVFIKYSVVVI